MKSLLLSMSVVVLLDTAGIAAFAQDSSELNQEVRKFEKVTAEKTAPAPKGDDSPAATPVKSGVDKAAPDGKNAAGGVSSKVLSPLMPPENPLSANPLPPAINPLG